MKITNYGCVIIYNGYVSIYYKIGLRGMIAAIKAAKRDNAECYVCNGKVNGVFNEGATKLWPK